MRHEAPQFMTRTQIGYRNLSACCASIMQVVLGLALTSDKQEEESKTNVFGHVCVCAFHNEHMLPIILLSDLHCHLHCPHHHHRVMLWLDLHLETYQREPAVYPGKQKDTKKHFAFIHYSYNSSMRDPERKQIANSLPAYAAEGDCPGCDVSCN